MKRLFIIVLLAISVQAFAQTYKIGLRFGMQYNQLYDVGPNYSVRYFPNYEFMLSENVLRKWNWSLQLQQGIASHFYYAKDNNTGEELFNPRAFGLLLDFSIKKSFFNPANDKFLFAPYVSMRYFCYYKGEITSAYHFGIDFLAFKKLNFFVSCHIPLFFYSGFRDRYDLKTYQLWGSDKFVISAGVVYKLVPFEQEKD
jgi:hypothetical protein